MPSAIQQRIVAKSVLFSFICAFGVLVASGWELIPFIFTLTSSLTSVAIVRKIKRRLDLVLSSIMLSIFNVIYIFVAVIVFNGTLTDKGIIFIGTICNGFLAGILALGFLTPLEYLLNTASVFRLMDLSDLNNSLMQKMLLTASGTYQHSLMVAQLAENACRDIDANALIARVGAYYHDIGKIDQNVRFEFILCKRLSDGTLADAACTFQQYRITITVPIFPFNQLIIYLSAKHHDRSFQHAFAFSHN